MARNGWRVRFPGKPQLKRTLCCNAPIQGACADAAMRALILVDAALFEAGIDGGPVIFIHDEIVLEVPEADAERARTIAGRGHDPGFCRDFSRRTPKWACGKQDRHGMGTA